MNVPKINQLAGADVFAIQTCPNDDATNKIPPKKDNNQNYPTCKEYNAFQIDVHTRSKGSICLKKTSLCVAQERMLKYK